tara:strand:- start:1024 stop:1608 length:585 start_codon:yes stop_codon:yes gene_type:complete
MKKLNGNKKINISVFISGKGSNLKNLIEFSKRKKSKFFISSIISNNPKAIGLKYSKKFKIKKKIINFINPNLAEKKILFFLKKEKVELICLAGFMKILSKNFVKKFKGNIINVHPSLLPKYKGLNTHQRVLNNNEKYSGCTIHFVTSVLDSGKIILQKRVKISKNDNAVSLAKKILKQEHIIYPKALMRIYPNL